MLQVKNVSLGAYKTFFRQNELNFLKNGSILTI